MYTCAFLKCSNACCWEWFLRISGSQVFMALGVVKGSHAGQDLALQHLQGGPAARRDVTHLYVY
jgi:hypothetical protein